MENFLIRAFLAGIAISIVAGPLGCFIIWKKMAYFGDSISHSSLFGISLGLIFGINLNLSIFIIALLFAAILMILQAKTTLAIDSILGVIAHFSLALGVVLLYLYSNQSIDLHSFLFGDILLVNKNDLIWIYVGVILSITLIIINWSSLVFYVINQDLAKAYGINTFHIDLMFNFLIALVVAISIQIIGVLLITSLLIIPAACAKLIAKSAHSMALLSSLIALLATLAGLTLSVFWDTPSGASIVVFLGLLFFLILIYSRIMEKFSK